jgi:1-acyl-sn-glycerol-3-phosphate acyltransferase
VICRACAAVRLTAYVALTLFAIPFQLVAMATGSRLQRHIPYWYHRFCLQVLNIELKVKGEPFIDGAGLIVANHASYLDIPVLGSIIKGSFVAKSEVASWPGFGFLAKLQRTVFVVRRSSKAGEQRDVIGQRLDAGETLILFPEGTSSDGNRVLPFKSALFAVADREIDGKPLPVQPVSVAATRLDGAAMTNTERNVYAWYGDMDLAPHLWQFLGLGKVTVEITVHPPLSLSDAGTRKDLARIAHNAVAQGHLEAMSGAGSDVISQRKRAEIMPSYPYGSVAEPFDVFDPLPVQRSLLLGYTGKLKSS